MILLLADKTNVDLFSFVGIKGYEINSQDELRDFYNAESENLDDIAFVLTTSKVVEFGEFYLNKIKKKNIPVTVLDSSDSLKKDFERVVGIKLKD